MKRKEFLSLSTRLGLFFGVASLASCKETTADKTTEILNNALRKKASGSAFGLTAPKIDRVKIAMIGLGNRGTTLLHMLDYLLQNEKAEIVALADLTQHRVEKAYEHLKTVQKNKPKMYSGTQDIWKKAVAQDNVDLVLVATPWQWHTPMALFAMENAKHVASEVPIAYTLDDCWKLVATAERTQKHCMMMENCCFNSEELWILNMINEGVFGEITHAEGAYIHDLRAYMLHKTYYQDQWRIKHHEKRNGNFYTTHGLGPVSQYMDIGRGDTYDFLTSMSSKEVSLSSAAKKEKSPFTKIACGDMNTTMIKTKQGKTIMLQFDVHTGRPYNRLNNVIGTKAVHEGYPSRLFINHTELQWSHPWLGEKEYKEYRERYDHPLWKKLSHEISDNKAGHGGMDFVMIYRLIKCLNEGLPLDINIYDSVLWSSITPLSELSVAGGSKPVSVPDFTGGTWKTARTSEVLRTL